MVDAVGVAVGHQVALTGRRVFRVWIGMATIVVRPYEDVDVMSLMSRKMLHPHKVTATLNVDGSQIPSFEAKSRVLGYLRTPSDAT